MSKVKLSFLRKLQLNSSVNSSDFVCNFMVMCSINRTRNSVSMSDNLNASHQLTGGNVPLHPTVNNFVQNHLYSTECAIEMIQVTTNTSFITVLLIHVFFSCFIRIHLNYRLFVLDFLDHQPQHRLISHFIFSREDWITDRLFHV